MDSTTHDIAHLSNKRILVGLDFDGPLHSILTADQDIIDGYGKGTVTAEQVLAYIDRSDKSRLFDRAHHVISALAPYPNAKIVIASTWRWSVSLEKMRDVLPKGLADRVVGVLDDKPSEKQGGRFIPGGRAALMITWMAKNGWADVPWLGIDDAPVAWHGYNCVASPIGGMHDVARIQLSEMLAKLCEVAPPVVAGGVSIGQQPGPLMGSQG